MLAADDQRAIGFILSGGEASDAVSGRLPLDVVGRIKAPYEDDPLYVLMDRAYEDGETRMLAFEWGYSPVTPQKKNRKHPWKYDKELYKQRNEVERMFRRLKGFRRIGTRYDKLDLMFSLFIYLALSLIAVRSLIAPSVNRP
jgi:transposase